MGRRRFIALWALVGAVFGGAIVLIYNGDPLPARIAFVVLSTLTLAFIAWATTPEVPW